MRLCDAMMRKLYATDASVYREMPQAVALPKTEEVIRKLVRFARRHGTLAGLIRHRDSEGPDPKGPYVEIAPPEADSYLPRSSVYERVMIAENVILKLPAPAEIAASKLAFADRIDRTKDLQDIKFIQEKFGSRREEILQKL